MARLPMRGLLLAGFILASFQGATAVEPRSPKIEFNRDIRPILSDKCFVCHGPDSAKRQGGLRLDQREAAIAMHDNSQAVVPGDAQKSEAFLRATSADPDLQMPPPNSNLKLSPTEIDLLRRWINEGAEYQPHWSFIPPRRIPPPASKQTAIACQPIDSFIHARLDQEDLTASPEADRRTLIRRVTLDLTGLPPSPDDVAAFVVDTSPDAYEKLVDRLLASPRYGERMALNWLDAARFADTNGYQTDGPRFMWRWRDWVIDAFNQNQPFDEFTIDQLAGDLLEEQTVRQSPIANARLIATGFNRNHRGNAEGGIIPEEFRVEYVVDRVETTSAVWLGLTIGCARCHDHKYDPISQRDFYQLFAFFNQVPEPGKYIRNDNSMPYLPAPTPDQQRHLTELQQERNAAESAWKALGPQIDQGIVAMVELIRSQGSRRDWSVSDKLDAKIEFDGDSQVVMATKNGQPPVPTDFVWKQGAPTFGEGRIAQAAQFDGQRWIESLEAGDFADDESFAISCWVKPTGTEAMTILARMDHDNASRGYELRREANGHLQALFSGRILDDLIRVETKATLPIDQWSHLFVSYDGSSAARGVAIRINGESTELKVITDLLSNPIKVKLPLCIGAGGSAAPFQGAIDELRTYRGRLTAESALALAAGDPISQIAARPLNDQTPRSDLEKLRECYLADYAPRNEQSTRVNLLQSRQKYNDYLATIPTTMVMQDRPQRDSFVLKRGEYDKPGEQVQAALPASLPVAKLPTPKSGQSLDRLDLARWLVSNENPLTARVTVNRLWQSLFGVGLVKTAEDFGTQGESPSHPELLDWLALEFSGDATTVAADRWDLKRSLRHMVTSATYRQSSAVNEPRDPDNRWLARGPRFRLPAEMIRDAALASSGLLVETLGGPSVKPYQPAGIWEELSAEAVPGPFAVYVQDHGPNLYRRGIYTFRKRTVPPPALAIFDASPREACRVSLPRTNTPLQALNLMNDVTYVEAARALAELAMKEGGASAPSRLTFAFRRVLSRDPSDRELKVLVDGFERRRQAYQQHPAETQELLQLGETVADPSLNPHELAAYTATASVIFNIDEFVAKP
ncbi:MAG: hypothetical protein JWP89_2913 [Schlesneria sp.]|nr:hypothetical protein [Schlesneria sp.]